MKNRPTEPGHWWWEDNDGDHYVAYFDDDMDYMARTDGRTTDYLSVEQFEDEYDFKRWFGKAVPPKNVDRYDLVEYDYDSFDVCITGDGKYVRLEDVKEYLVD